MTILDSRQPIAPAPSGSGEGLKVVFLGGKQAGCVGLLATIAAGCCVQALVHYDDLVDGLGVALHLPRFASIAADGLRETLTASDLLISVHGREVVSSDLLSLPRLGGINVHPCLYAYKGADPVGRLLADRNPRASVGVHRMTQELDRGSVLVEEFVDVSEAKTVTDVYNRLYPHYAIALLKAISLVRRPE